MPVDNNDVCAFHIARRKDFEHTYLKKWQMFEEIYSTWFKHYTMYACVEAVYGIV